MRGPLVQGEEVNPVEVPIRPKDSVSMESCDDAKSRWLIDIMIAVLGYRSQGEGGLLKVAAAAMADQPLRFLQVQNKMPIGSLAIGSNLTDLKIRMSIHPGTQHGVLSHVPGG